MGLPAAKQQDTVVAVDTHVVLVPAPPGPPQPTPLPHPFQGHLDGALSRDVKIGGRPAATRGSTATNQPAHVPTPPGTTFQKPPSNRAVVQGGSSTVWINGKGAARHGDPATTCNDPADLPVGTVVVAPGATVFVG